MAEILSKAKNTAVSAWVEAGIIESTAGKVRLIRPSEFPSEWEPALNDRSSTCHCRNPIGTDGGVVNRRLVAESKTTEPREPEG